VNNLILEHGSTKRLLSHWAESWWPVAIIVLLVAVTLYQRWQFTHPVRLRPLRAGDRVAALALADVRDRPVIMSWDSKAKTTLIYVFSPECVWCGRNLEAMKALTAQATAYRVICVSLTAKGLGAYLLKHPIGCPVYTAPAKTAVQLKLIATPETLVVSPKGLVQHVWFGVYAGL
jgi:hypothetical protein